MDRHNSWADKIVSAFVGFIIIAFVIALILLALEGIGSLFAPSNNTSSSSSPSTYVSSTSAKNHIGDYETVKIQKAYCSYQPTTSNSPTFCNDKPYPRHNFTFIMWEEDVSYYDGQCILVTGKITTYDGKPQITTESFDDVRKCP